MTLPLGFVLPRPALMNALNHNERVVLQVEKVIETAMRGNPAAINTAQVTADLGVTNAALADAKAVLADAKAVAAQGTADQAVLDAAAAQADADALEVQQYAVAAADLAVTPNARVLTGTTGLTIDLTTPNVLQLLLNVITALGYTPADLAGADFSGLVKLSGGVWLGVHSGHADAAITGTMTVLDSTGTPRKLATIA